MNLKETKNLLRRYSLRPSKRLGQNFLIERGAVRKIIETADLRPDDIALEIGPGLGVLTQELAKRAKKVMAVEKDPRMIDILRETLKDFKNIEIVAGDILKIANWKLESGNWKVIGSLPFYLTGPVIRKFLESTEGRPQQMVLVVQKEVAQRICARVPKMNLLAVSVQFYAQPKIISYLSKKSFWPSPKVNSAIIKITPQQQRTDLGKPDRGQTSVDLLFKIVRAGFCQPRKQLVNNFSKMLKLDKKEVKLWLLKNNIQPSQRAQTLKINDWLRLTDSFPF